MIRCTHLENYGTWQGLGSIILSKIPVNPAGTPQKPQLTPLILPVLRCPLYLSPYWDPPSTSPVRRRALPLLALETATAGGFTAHRPEPCSGKTRKKSKGEYSNFGGAGECGYQIAAEYRLKVVEPGLARKLIHSYCLCKVIFGQSACSFR